MVGTARLKVCQVGWAIVDVRHSRRFGDQARNQGWGLWSRAPSPACPRSSRGVADRHADCHRNGADLLCRGAPLRHRAFHQRCEMGGSARRPGRARHPAPIYTFFSEFDVSWAQELCIFMFIWMAKFGAAYGVRTGIHVGVDVIVNLLPPEKRKRVIMFAIGCGALFTGVIAAFGATFVAQMYATGQQSYDLEWPMWLIYLAIPLGSGLMCFRFLQVFWSYYWTGILPHHSEAHVEGTETVDPVLPSTSPHGTVPERWSNPLALLLILAPIFIILVCFAHTSGV